jgi:PAS domain S-box-containing protein
MTLTTRLAIAMIALVAIAVTAVGWLSYRSLEQQILPRVLDRTETHSRLVAFDLQSHVSGARGDIAGFQSATALNGLIRAHLAGGIDPVDGLSERTWHDRIAERLLAELKAKPNYAQFRIIGIEDGGREIIRVDRSGPNGTVRLVPATELQRKDERPYFKDTVGLPANEEYVSALDLNQENGVVETPYVPTLRIAAPLHASDGKPFGIVIVNVDMRPAFDRVRASVRQGGSIYVVGSRGDYLVHPDRSREFGSDLGKQIDWRKDFPSLVPLLGTMQNVGGTVPDQTGKPDGVALAPALLADKEWVGVIETVPNAIIMGPATTIRNTSLMVGLIAVLGAAALALLIARSLTRPIVQLTAAVEGITHGGVAAIPVKAGGETGVLARAFARMVAESTEKTLELQREVAEHRRTEAARAHHAERESLFSAAVESSSDAIITQSLDGIITGWNPAAERLFGYSAAEAVGQHISIIVPPDRQSEMDDIIRRVGWGEAIEHNETIRWRKDGTPVEVSLGMAPIKAASGAIIGISKTARDMTESQQAQETLRESEQLARGIINSAIDAFVQVDQRGIIQDWNPQAETIFGWRREEVLGKNVFELMGRQDGPGPIRAALERFLLSGREQVQQPRHEVQIKRRDGRELTAELSITALRTRGGFVFNAFIRDITEQNRTQQTLRQQAEELRRIFETSQDLIMVMDSRGALIQISPSCETILGYPPDEMIGRTGIDFVHSDHLANSREEMRALRRGERPKLADMRCLHKSGREVWLSWLGVWSEPVRRFFFVGRDMSESRKAQETLRESEQMARGIINTALDAFIQNDESNNIVDWNSQAEAMFGWSREEALGKNLIDLIIAEPDHAYFKAALPRYLESGQDQILGRRRETLAKRHDGTEFRAELSVTSLNRREGILFNTFVRDLTDKTAAEERIRQSEKMEAVGQLTGGIAHDFNNILTVITGTIEILADAVKDKPQLAAISRMIDEAATRGADLTQHLLAFARKQPLEPQETDINALIIDTAKLLQRTLGEHVEIESVFEQETCPATVDPNQLVTAILNLALNARDAMPSGGKLFIETGFVVLDENYANMQGDVRPGRYAMIAVSDTGTGIPAANLDRVFDPFFTSKGLGKGTGLGLSMVYGFVKQSAGHIKIYSEEGHGTTIKMYLPPAAAVAPATQTGTISTILGGDETILVVEDDKMVRDYVLTQLHSLGYVTLDAANATEALAIVRDGRAFDLLFTDVIMPGLNGRQLAEEIQKVRPELKVLFTSGYTENAIIHHGRLDEGVLLLAKPYRKSDMATMIRKALTQ